MKSFFKKDKMKKNEKKNSFLNYELAKEEFNNHAMNLAKSIHSWKLIAFFSMMITLFSLSSIVYLVNRSTLVPYVIEVDETGNAKAINPATQINYIPKEQEVIFTLRDYIKKSRWISLDPVLQNMNLIESMYFLEDNMQRKMKNIFDKEGLKDFINKKYTRDIQIKNIIKLSGTSNIYQAKWTETIYNDEGVQLSSYKMLGVFTIDIKTPKNVNILQHNPLGIYIQDFNYSREEN